MGLMDKFKNLFTDEEVVEEEEDQVEIKEVKKEEPKLPTFMREKIAKEEKVKEEDTKITKLEPQILDENEVKVDSKEVNEVVEKPAFKFPIDFEDSDFTETRSRQSMHSKSVDVPVERKVPHNLGDEKKVVPKKKEVTKVSKLYKDKKEEDANERKSFRATPIISPIYGVLDKTYDPNEVKSRDGKNFEGKRPSKNVDFDSVRKKAYGNLTKEIKENLMCENCEYLREAKECKKRKKEEVCEEDNEIDYQDVTMDEAAENYFDYGVAYDKKRDSYREEDVVEEENDVLVNDYSSSDEEVGRKNEIPPVKSSINLLSTLKKSMGDEENSGKKENNLELTDDLFNLIDSMYDERNDGK